MLRLTRWSSSVGVAGSSYSSIVLLSYILLPCESLDRFSTGFVTQALSLASSGLLGLQAIR